MKKKNYSASKSKFPLVVQSNIKEFSVGFEKVEKDLGIPCPLLLLGTYFPACFSFKSGTHDHSKEYSPL